MKIIYNDSTDPFFNLAFEEYMLKHTNDDCFILWRNAKTVVVGKFQNAFAEINRNFVDQHGIKVVRRMTGGGAVFHDLGNLNFTFIQSESNGGRFEFEKFCKPIIEVLNKLGVNARFEGRNDMTIEGMKFAGNAELLWGGKVMHHGCILFSSKLDDLAGALNVDELKFKDKAVKSVRSRVTNVYEHLPEKIDVIRFKDLIIKHLIEVYDDACIYVPTNNIREKVLRLAMDKYALWDWNFGKSPRYDTCRVFKSSRGGKLEFRFDVSCGVINDVEIYGDFFSGNGVDDVRNLLKGVRFEKQDIKNILYSIDIEDYFSNVTVEEIVDGIMEF